MISYCRMEAKLIHGQTTTVLQNHYKCDGIIVIDEILARDSVMKKVFAAAAPASVKTYFFDEEKGIEQLKKAEDSERNYFVILRNPLTTASLVRKGYRFKLPVTCGQQFNRENSVSIMQGVGLTEEEMVAMDFLVAQGVEVVMDPSCKLENIPWQEIRNK
ncbi:MULTISPECIES: PTS sugar transporter subunit IIB [unclassified Clostridium]|jgi:mannose/fructose/N-acetylgalactosamine-specific phosphotransferase system component IIB|uniref:PTS sugar transporter subunit IIB n=1 Tax=unclassified Clostridium TaxID=2614128 RepID=UPI001105C981|nr:MULTISPECIES: PTS sugar transporter subunit IIB [unclassified Clostridium]